MRILSLWRGRRKDSPESEEHLDAILEDSLRDPVVGETYPDDADEHKTHVADARERILRNSHFFNDTWFRTNTLEPEQKEIVRDFLLELSQVVKNRGVILTSEVIDHLSGMLASGETEIAYWQEPWMVPYKITRRRAVDLFEHCLAQTAKSVPFERLSECGIKARWAKNYEELSDKLRADSMDGSSLTKVFRTALVRVARADDRSDVRSICYTMDYALACIGDRQAMMRISETLRRVCVPAGDDDDSMIMTGARRLELSVVSDAWRRLSSIVRSQPMGDGERELAEMIAPWKMDLRKLESYFEDKPGWVLPPENVVPIAAAPGSAGDWRITLFTPASAPQDTPPPRPVATFDQKRQAMLLEMFGSEETRNILKRMAAEDAGTEIGEDELRMILSGMEKARASGRTAKRIEEVVAGFANVVHMSQSLTEFYASLAKKPEEADEEDPFEAEDKQAPPAMTVLDRIGESEESSKASAAVTFGRLLQPFELKSAVRSADEVYAALSSEFPWMREANEMAARAVAFAQRTESKALWMKPVLLQGLPGLGKTRWMRRFSEVTGVPTHRASLSGVDTTKSIIGSERGWANARPSLPAYAFMGTEAANPIIYVDEVDKATKWDSIADAFLPMIEGETASSYPDIYLLGNLDLSAASFIFSANDLSKVSGEFLSRVKVVSIRAPNENEVAPVIRTMVRETCEKSLLSDEEVSAIMDNLVSRSREIYLKTTNLREVKQFIFAEVEKTIWSPPGPRLVK
ncbi:Lon protease 1 [compost metagenome]